MYSLPRRVIPSSLPVLPSSRYFHSRPYRTGTRQSIVTCFQSSQHHLFSTARKKATASTIIHTTETVPPPAVVKSPPPIYGATYWWALLKFALVAYGITEYIVEPSITVGPSMYPTLSEHGDVLLVDKTVNLPCNLGSQIRSGDIIIADSPTDRNKKICKRVRAIAGEQNPKGQMMLPGQVWLEGDNHKNSLDSRTYGPIPRSNITGRAMICIWPLKKIGRIAGLPQ